MGKLAEAFVDIEPNLNPLRAGLPKAQAMIGGFVSTAQGMLGGLVIGGGVALIGRGLFEATKKASDLGETLSKVRVTFGSSSGSMLRQADELAKKFGVVKRESLDAAASFGLMGRAAGLSSSEAAKLGNEFVKIGLDAASYFNTSNEEAFQKIRSGLIGEAEPLRAFGVLLTEDAVKLEAVRIGISKVKRELTEGEKVRARASLIKQQLGPSSGDLERTADSAANQLRILQGRAENLTVELGEKLIPALVSGMQAAEKMGGAIKAAFGREPVDLFADSVNGVAIAMKALTPGANEGPQGKTNLDTAGPAKNAGLSALRALMFATGVDNMPGFEGATGWVDRNLQQGIDRGSGTDKGLPALTFQEKTAQLARAAKEREQARLEANKRRYQDELAQRGPDFARATAGRDFFSKGKGRISLDDLAHGLQSGKLGAAMEGKDAMDLWKSVRREQGREAKGNLINALRTGAGMMFGEGPSRLDVMTKGMQVAGLVGQRAGLELRQMKPAAEADVDKDKDRRLRAKLWAITAADRDENMSPADRAKLERRRLIERRKGPQAKQEDTTPKYVTPQGPSQHFGDVEDYARSGIAGALENPMVETKRAIEKNGEKLDAVKEEVAKTVGDLAKNLGSLLGVNLPIR